MAGNFNKVMLMGNLTRDIEIRHTSGNTAVGNFGLAVNRKYKTQAGEQREEVTFVDCQAWGRTAEVMAQYLGKGRPVFIEGRLKFDQWEDKNGGGKRSKLSVVVDSFQFIDYKDDAGGNTGGHQQGGYAQQGQQGQRSQQGGGGQQSQRGGYENNGGGSQGRSQYAGNQGGYQQSGANAGGHGGGGAPVDDDIPFAPNPMGGWA